MASIGSNSGFFGSHFGSNSLSFAGELIEEIDVGTRGVVAAETDAGTGTGVEADTGTETVAGIDAGTGTDAWRGVGGGAGVKVIAAGDIVAGWTAIGNCAGLAAIFTGFKNVAGTIVLLLAVNAGLTFGWIIVDKTCPWEPGFNVTAELAGSETSGDVEVMITGVTVTILLFRDMPDIDVITEAVDDPINWLLALAITSCWPLEVIILPGIKWGVKWGACRGLADMTGFTLAVLGKVGSVTIPDEEGSLSVVKCWATIWTGADNIGAVNTLVAEVSWKGGENLIFKQKENFSFKFPNYTYI